jgi:hypothetical protein
MVKENKDERQTMVYKILHKKLKTEETIFHLKSDVDASALGGLAVPAPTYILPRVYVKSQLNINNDVPCIQLQDHARVINQYHDGYHCWSRNC